MNKSEIASASFDNDFQTLIAKALGDGVAPVQVVAALTNAEFEIRNAMLQLRREQAARALSEKIIPVNGNFKLPPRGNLQ